MEHHSHEGFKSKQLHLAFFIGILLHIIPLAESHYHQHLIKNVVQADYLMNNLFHVNCPRRQHYYVD